MLYLKSESNICTCYILKFSAIYLLPHSFFSLTVHYTFILNLLIDIPILRPYSRKINVNSTDKIYI